jgi:hypothetical protein
MHQPTHEADTTPTRNELIEALHHHNATAKRCPRHWLDRYAGIHNTINNLLTQLEMVAELEAMSDGQATAQNT